jgi:hypothetical protein
MEDYQILFLLIFVAILMIRFNCGAELDCGDLNSTFPLWIVFSNKIIHILNGECLQFGGWVDAGVGLGAKWGITVQ